MRDSMGGGGGRSTDSPINGASAKKRSRQIYTPQQLKTLESMFHKNNFPDRDTIDNLCQLLDINDTRLMNWFKNRRARSRREPKEDSPSVDLDTDVDGQEEMSPSDSPKYQPPVPSVKPKAHIGDFSIQKIMEKGPAPVPESPDQHNILRMQRHPGDQLLHRIMPKQPSNSLPVMPNMNNIPTIPNHIFHDKPHLLPNNPPPIRHLHQMASLIPHTPDRSLTSSLSQVLMSQIQADQQLTPDVHARSLRHLESLQTRSHDMVIPRNGYGYTFNDHNLETGNPLWDLYFSYRDEIVPIKEYSDAVPGVTKNVIMVEEDRTMLVL